jgi:2',3'-cyclic-nucleotide 2'-phosphodiesterase
MAAPAPAWKEFSADAMRPRNAHPVTVLMVGDIVGKPGRRAIENVLPGWVARHKPDLVIANIENAAGGFGITNDTFRELDALGIDVYTSGNHIWQKKDGLRLLETHERILRPANYPRRTPGNGYGVFRGRNGRPIGVMNLSGRTFMDPHQTGTSPFDAAELALAEIGRETHVSIIDFHAEATSEKQALGWYLAGRVSAVLGTHTHVQTADEKILPSGTAYITDVGMTGPTDSVIGMGKKAIIEKFLTGMPRRYEVARTGPTIASGVVIRIYSSNGRAFHIERLQEVTHQ